MAVKIPREQIASSISDPCLQSLTFKEVLSCFKKANKVLGKNGDVDIEVWIENKMYRIVRVGQFSFVPTVTLTLVDKPEFEL